MTRDKRNLVLTGFMGTGKTMVARIAAERLGRRLVDMDQVIVDRAGIPISEIFARRGEDAFREMERDLCRELGSQDELVIATGGGALVDAQNRAVLERTGCIICLDCALEELSSRLRYSKTRPLLEGEELGPRLRALLDQRRSAYAEIAHHIDTTHLDPCQIADIAIQMLQTRATFWRVNTPTGSYQVQLVQNGLSQLGALLHARGISSQVVVVGDEHVWPLYGDAVLDGLRQSQIPAFSVVLPAGEQHKTLETVRTLYDHFLDAGLDRSGAVLAIGGGVITDMTGFAAATFMRGVSVIQVPTTLLGMIDASVGGKVAVDHPRGKNLVGAFIEPLLVMLDPITLHSLPDIDYRSGLAEVIKAGIIADPELFEAFEESDEPADRQWLIERALAVKIAIVEEDPYERGRRAVLNLGHTFAHALEVLADYGLYHGLAVSMGMAIAAHLAEIRGVCSTETRNRIIDTLARHRLPTTIGRQPPQDIYRAMGTDKKKQGQSLRYVLPTAIGDVIIERDIPQEQVFEALERTMS